MISADGTILDGDNGDTTPKEFPAKKLSIFSLMLVLPNIGFSLFGVGVDLKLLTITAGFLLVTIPVISAVTAFVLALLFQKQNSISKAFLKFFVLSNFILNLVLFIDVTLSFVIGPYIH